MRKTLNVGGARLTSQYLGGVLLNPRSDWSLGGRSPS
jgi:hypothetical protein